MRPFIFLAPLGMLMLASCEPAGGSSDTGITRSRDQRDGIAANTASNAQLAAQDSLRKSPTAERLADGTRGTCPVHHKNMKIREIPIVFEDPDSGGEDADALSASAPFPFGAERIVSSGNALLPGATLTARVYQCASCIHARRAAETKSSQPAPPAGPE